MLRFGVRPFIRHVRNTEGGPFLAIGDGERSCIPLMLKCLNGGDNERSVFLRGGIVIFAVK